MQIAFGHDKGASLYSECHPARLLLLRLPIQKKQFEGLSREKFLAALRAEGIPGNSGLGVIEGKPMNKEGCLEDAFRSNANQKEIHVRDGFHPAADCGTAEQNHTDQCSSTIGTRVDDRLDIRLNANRNR